MNFRSEGILENGGKIYTETMQRTPLYGEDIIRVRGKLYREWDPKRSKLSAAIRKNLRHFPINVNSSLLYLGASTGTTVSHVSDICKNGRITAVEKAYEPFSKLLRLSESRANIFPILEDALKVEKYGHFIDKPEVLYQDIAQRNQAQIFNTVSSSFKSIEAGILIIKVRAVTSRKGNEEVLKNQLEIIENYKVKELVDLTPYSIANYLAVLS
ncbi:MAG: fibrillarin-like rRNA/tRNA 2'-O-methyltransferase [Thermoplasmataceae archaeon]